MSAKKVVVLLNGKSRNRAAAKLRSRIEAAFKLHNFKVEVRLIGKDLVGAVQEALRDGVSTIVAAGGDGTVRTVAAALVHRGGAALGVIPAGTFNHFAKDMRIPMDVEGAAQVISQGKVHRVDVGSVNGRYFVNSVGLGIHPLFVRRREAHAQYLGKWLAIPIALFQAVRRFRVWQLNIVIDGKRRSLSTPFVFIGNNNYQVEQLGLSNRQHLNDGKLYVYALECQSRWQLVKMVLRGVLGDLGNDKYFHAFTVSSCRIESKRPMYVTLDGELTQLKSPLEFTVFPDKLKVLVPEGD